MTHICKKHIQNHAKKYLNEIWPIARLQAKKSGHSCSIAFAQKQCKSTSKKAAHKLLVKLTPGIET